MTTFDFNLGDTPVVIHAPAVGEFDSEAADAMFAAFEADPRRVVGLDVETTAHDKLGPMHRDFRVRTVQLATEAEAWVLRLDDDEQRVMAEAVLADDTFRFCSHTRYDVLAVWREFGIDISGRWADTRLLARIANPLCFDKFATDDVADLKTLTTERLGPELADMDRQLDEVFKALWVAQGGKKNTAKKEVTAYGFSNVDLADEVFVSYAGLDAIACRQLYPHLIGETQTAAELLGMELWLAGEAARMQIRGMRVDRERLDAVEAVAKGACDAAEAALVELIGLTPRQTEKLAAWFTADGVDFEALGHGRTKGGKPSMAEDEVAKMVEYPLSDTGRRVVELLLAYKEHENEMGKTKEMRTHIELSFDGRLHPEVDSLGTITARMSSKAPNVQNYSKASPVMRYTLLADEGYTLIGADFDQVELRVAAALSQEEDLLRTIREGGDLHQLTADKVGCERKVGKVTNFLLLYGGGYKPLMAATGLPEEEARRIVADYWVQYPALREYRDRIQQGIDVRTRTHRLLPATTGYDGDYDTRKFLNYLIQSSSRDLLVLAWYRLFQMGMADMVWVPIHDELILQVPTDRLEECMAKLQSAMTMDFMGVPITATSVALLDEEGVSRWMPCDHAEKIAAAKAEEQTVSSAA